MKPRSLLRRPRSRFAAGIKTWFVTGLIIAGPLAVTGSLVWWFINSVDKLVKPLVPPYLLPDYYLPVPVPGVGVVIAFVAITFLGFLAANLAGRTMIRLGETILERMPIVRSIYKSVKQVFETVFSQQGTSFRRVGLVQFPNKGMWSIVFISSPPSQTLNDHLPIEDEHMSVFLPCTPNPTTGFYFYLPKADVVEIPLTPEQAAKLIMSAGMIQPEVQGQLAKLAAKAIREKNISETDVKKLTAAVDP